MTAACWLYLARMEQNPNEYHEVNLLTLRIDHFILIQFVSYRNTYATIQLYYFCTNSLCAWTVFTSRRVKTDDKIRRRSCWRTIYGRRERRSSAGRAKTTMEELRRAEDNDCRYLRWNAVGESPDAASIRARDAFTSAAANIISRRKRERGSVRSQWAQSPNVKQEEVTKRNHCTFH